MKKVSVIQWSLCAALSALTVVVFGMIIGTVMHELGHIEYHELKLYLDTLEPYMAAGMVMAICLLMSMWVFEDDEYNKPDPENFIKYANNMWKI